MLLDILLYLGHCSLSSIKTRLDIDAVLSVCITSVGSIELFYSQGDKRFEVVAYISNIENP
jgi:hypothetical protein